MITFKDKADDPSSEVCQFLRRYLVIYHRRLGQELLPLEMRHIGVLIDTWETDWIIGWLRLDQILGPSAMPQALSIPDTSHCIYGASWLQVLDWIADLSQGQLLVGRG